MRRDVSAERLTPSSRSDRPGLARVGQHRLVHMNDYLIAVGSVACILLQRRKYFSNITGRSSSLWEPRCGAEGVRRIDFRVGIDKRLHRTKEALWDRDSAAPTIEGGSFAFKLSRGKPLFRMVTDGRGTTRSTDEPSERWRDAVEQRSPWSLPRYLREGASSRRVSKTPVGRAFRRVRCWAYCDRPPSAKRSSSTPRATSRNGPAFSCRAGV